MYCLVHNVNAGIARGAACKVMLALRKIVIVLYGTDLYMYVYVLKGPGLLFCLFLGYAKLYQPPFSMRIFSLLLPPQNIWFTAHSSQSWASAIQVRTSATPQYCGQPNRLRSCGLKKVAELRLLTFKI